MVKKIKALVLLSGGLDSMLSAKLLAEQGIEVTGLVYESCFFGSEAARKAADTLKIPLKIIDLSVEHLSLVKNPPHGYGKAANPCIDCHALMLKKAKSLMEKSAQGGPALGWDFVATGEVLGERPFSQNYKALLKIQKISGLGDLLLRPLSAQLLPETLPEKQGWVDCSQLADIQGRTRQKQLALAKKYKIKSFPQPAGGCILTERAYGKKLFLMLKNWPQCTPDDIKLLSLGRVFWKGDCLIVLGRNKEENEKLEKQTKKGDVLVEPKDFMGPTALIRQKAGKTIPNPSGSTIQKAKQLLKKFSKKSRQTAKATFKIQQL